MSEKSEVAIVGGGLAGSEAALFLASHGVKCVLFEARPVWKSEAHTTDLLGELVCSNSLKTLEKLKPGGVLKRELEKLGSHLLYYARKNSVKSGKALAVDRKKFAMAVTEAVEKHPLIDLVREEVKDIPNFKHTVIATGPLTSPDFAEKLEAVLGSSLYFYDAIAPVVEAESIDMTKVFRASRWEDGTGDDGDYLNCPLNKEQYEKLVSTIITAPKVTPHSFEKPKYFESCLPVEIMTSRGEDVLRFGPLRPVGLRDPRTGERPWAVVQLRAENETGSAYNLVGFQTRMTYKAQKEVVRMIPGLENAVILRYGEIHRNTYLDAPELLKDGMLIPGHENVYIAGLLLGVEGYVESMATGLLAALRILFEIKGKRLPDPPVTTALGGLLRHIKTKSGKYTPTNINYGLWPPLNERLPKKKRHEKLALRAIQDFDEWIINLKDLLKVRHD